MVAHVYARMAIQIFNQGRLKTTYVLHCFYTTALIFVIVIYLHVCVNFYYLPLTKIMTNTHNV